MNNLAGVDLNLLVVLEALLSERHVSRAAIRLNKSQPAISHALARLRHLLDDPLLVRRPGGLEPTARAMEIAPALAEALDRMRHLLAPAGFDAAKERRTFRLAMSDYGAAVILPALLPLLRTQAPYVDLAVSQASREVMVSQVVDGEIDLAFGVFPGLDASVRSHRLFDERFACLADAASLGGELRMDLPAYLERPHALVDLRPDRLGEVDKALVELGHKRRLCLIIPHWGVAPRLIVGTDLVLTVASRILPAPGNGLCVFNPPFEIPDFQFTQIWHKRRDGDPAHQWLRARLRHLFED
ncbi:MULTISPECIES: LysR substrate-binding domain-containing protein [unclassified Mesorhizobium]|uniref:LysR substrate-binding domain-containing protein n=1 Tax=unclassified Mesorhizobium TaxID=325217 RepID=UPI0011295A1E|nr:MULTISPECIES: LysR substrate-binding domain-containing protein [unclassified Mesorhizobium]TPL00099.1 LysR family transcriptional regulator [Mesorhizobium sp. B2-4-16]TPL69060.1 LysR family transcriptional regulator [Mesorhizobium sp. B2-4-3]